MNINLDNEQLQIFNDIILHDLELTMETLNINIQRAEWDYAVWALDRIDTCFAVLESLGAQLSVYYEDMDELIQDCPSDVIYRSKIFDRYDGSEIG